MYITDRFKVKRLEKLPRFKQNFTFDCLVSSVGRSTVQIHLYLGVSKSLGCENWILSRPIKRQEKLTVAFGGSPSNPRGLLQLAAGSFPWQATRGRGAAGLRGLGVTREGSSGRPSSGCARRSGPRSGLLTPASLPVLSQSFFKGL